MKKSVVVKICCVVFACSTNVYATINVFFSPDNTPQKKLIELISHAQKKIYVAVFIISDKKICTHLITAKKRGIDVQIITDQKCLKSKNNKISYLKDNGIELFIYKPKQRGFFQSIMHDKFAIIDDAIWTGSLNWTWSACHKNEENVLLIAEEPKVIKRYEEQFAQLKRRCFFPKQKRVAKNNASRKEQIKEFLLRVRQQVARR